MRIGLGLRTILGFAASVAPGGVAAAVEPATPDMPTCVNPFGNGRGFSAYFSPHFGSTSEADVGGRLVTQTFVSLNQRGVRVDREASIHATYKGTEYTVAVSPITLTDRDLADRVYALPASDLHFTDPAMAKKTPRVRLGIIASVSGTRFVLSVRIGSFVDGFDLPPDALTDLRCIVPTRISASEVLYGGVVKGVITLQYRELVNGAVVPGSMQEGQFDLSAGSEVAFKGVHLKILSADNTGIHYVVTDVRPAEPDMAKDLSWEVAVQRVLEGSSDPMRCADIAEQVSVQGLKRKLGANPAASIAAILSKSLKEEDTPFQRVGPGQYTLRSQLRDASAADRLAAAEEDDPEQSGALRAFGMYWRRDHVVWRGKPKLFGRQGKAATKVNFADQVGVYLLHDRDRVIYVGRAADSLVARLMAHTIDRLGGRWDRFSWFGLRNVGPSGELIHTSLPWDERVVIETLEALLIESLEPPLNRRRGDNFSGVEYMQAPDPEIERMEQRRVIDQLARTIDANGPG